MAAFLWSCSIIGTLGFDAVDLMGFSLGGFVAQDIALKALSLVRKLILTGTDPAGGAGFERIGAVSWTLILKGMATLRDPKTYLFFTSIASIGAVTGPLTGTQRALSLVA